MEGKKVDDRPTAHAVTRRLHEYNQAAGRVVMEGQIQRIRGKKALGVLRGRIIRVRRVGAFVECQRGEHQQKTNY